MATFRIDQGGAIAKHIVQGVMKAADRGLLSAALRLQQIIQTQIIPAENPPPVNKRAYVAGWGQRPEKIDGGYLLKNTIPHALFIEDGVRAENVRVGATMIEALTEWVLNKGLVGKGPGKTIEARQMAWAIATSMTKKGIFNRGGSQGLGIAKKAAKRAPEIVREEVEREIAKEMG